MGELGPGFMSCPPPLPHMDGKSSWLLKTVTSIDLTEFTDNLLPLELLTLAFVTKTSVVPSLFHTLKQLQTDETLIPAIIPPL